MSKNSNPPRENENFYLVPEQSDSLESFGLTLSAPLTGSNEIRTSTVRGEENEQSTQRKPFAIRYYKTDESDRVDIPESMRGVRFENSDPIYTDWSMQYLLTKSKWNKTRISLVILILVLSCLVVAFFCSTLFLAAKNYGIPVIFNFLNSCHSFF
jgi:hypothetical protein